MDAEVMNDMLKEKFQDWLEYVEEGDSRFQLITRVKNEWYFIQNNRATRILALHLAVDSGTGVKNEYTYPNGVSADMQNIDNRVFMVVLKNESKLIFENEDRYYSFGITKAKLEEQSEPSMEAMMLYVRTSGVHTWIYGNQATESVNVVCSLVDEAPEAITLCTEALHRTLEKGGGFLREVTV